MNGHIESETLVWPVGELCGKHQMGRAGNRQELGQTLQQTQEDNV
jgi:hypothetical protein